MSTETVYHYTYRITNIKLNKHYYGKRSSKVLPKKDLGIKYFSSSKDKDFIKDQKENPQDYNYKIIYVFDSVEKALNLEVKLHNKFDVGVNTSFYNRCKQTSIGWDSTGTTFKRDRNTLKHLIRPANIYSFETDELIASNIIIKEWCRENTVYDPSSLTKTARYNPSIKASRTNRCHHKGIYAIYIEELDRNKNSRSLLNRIINGARPVDIICYKTGKVLAEKVSVNVWCKENGYTKQHVLKTLKSDHTKPSTATNPHQHKGIYARYSFSK